MIGIPGPGSGQLPTTRQGTGHEFLLLVREAKVDSKCWVHKSCQALLLVDALQCLQVRSIELDDLQVLLDSRWGDRLGKDSMAFAHCVGYQYNSRKERKVEASSIEESLTLVGDKDRAGSNVVLLRNFLHALLLKERATCAPKRTVRLDEDALLLAKFVDLLLWKVWVVLSSIVSGVHSIASSSFVHTSIWLAAGTMVASGRSSSRNLTL
jgi:hypothetical protein